MTMSRIQGLASKGSDSRRWRRALSPRWSRPATAGLVVPSSAAISASGRPCKWWSSIARRWPSGSVGQRLGHLEQLFLANHLPAGRRLLGGQPLLDA